MRAAAANARGMTSRRIGASFALKYPRIADSVRVNPGDVVRYFQILDEDVEDEHRSEHEGEELKKARCDVSVDEPGARRPSSRGAPDRRGRVPRVPRRYPAGAEPPEECLEGASGLSFEEASVPTHASDRERTQSDQEKVR